MTQPPDNFLHVYGQYCEHSEAVIRGTDAGLRALRDAIDAALAGSEAAAHLFATDGEGYTVKVQLSSTIGGVGTPEYIYRSEMEIWQRGRERMKALSMHAPGWETIERSEM